MNNNGSKILCDSEDLLSAFNQTKDLATTFVEKHFDEFFKHGKSNYHGQLEKKQVLWEMNEWIRSAFTIVASNTEGHNLTPFLTENIDKELVDSIEENKEKLEDELEQLIKKRTAVAERINHFVKLTTDDQMSKLESIEFIDDEEEEKGSALPTLKRPLEEVKKEYKESYESLNQLCEELASKRNRLESYQSLAKQFTD
ncbi:hypothetical protein K501DRAFT_335844 [Backusella circina FSU 941]|nr:hypothetical protein K501DRAFT_335844 [Backusella circina FSU 941]